MPRNYKTISCILALATLTGGITGAALAQLDNKPFSFKNSPSGGPGMSTGGRQAIINEKLFNATPDNLQRGADGQLVDVVKGPGQTAIVFVHGTNTPIPGFKGTDFRDGNPLISVGVFNAFFGPSHSQSSSGGYSYAQLHSAALVNNWTQSVVYNSGMAPYYNNNPVDTWTAYVYTLDRP